MPAKGSKSDDVIKENTGFWTHPMVGEEELNTVTEVLHVIALALAANGALGAYKSKFYYFNFGRAAGAVLGLTITGLDKWLDLGIIWHY